MNSSRHVDVSISTDVGEVMTPITVLDGGMGHQLKAMGVPITGVVGTMRRFLGVAMANLEQPELVRDAHLTYIDAGASVITTNNYSVVPKCLDCADSKDSIFSLQELLDAAGSNARAACTARPDRTVTVAGCVPPLADSYRADLVGPYSENIVYYRTIVPTISKYADLLLCETMSSGIEAKAAASVALEQKKPVWISWTLDEKTEGRLRSGETIEEALLVIKDQLEHVDAILFNCTSPEAISRALPILRALLPSRLRIGAYANGFVTAESGSGEYRDLTPAQYYSEFVMDWLSAGATIIGGCCGVFPRHIEYIAAQALAPGRS